MFEDEFRLQDYIHVLVKWRWLIAAIFVTTVLYSTLKVLKQVPIYQATARIIIDKRQSEINPFDDRRGWSNWDNDYLHSQYKIITSRELARNIAEKLNLQPPAPPSSRAEDASEPTASVSFLQRSKTRIKKISRHSRAPDLFRFREGRHANRTAS